MNENKIGRFIASERKKKNMTQKDLAEKLYVTDRAVSKWERGLSYPDIMLLEKLGTILEVSVSELLHGERIESINIEKADDIVKDSLVIYQKDERKKIFHKIKIIIPTSFLIIVILLTIYCMLSMKHLGRIYLTPHTYIEPDSKEYKKSRKNADIFIQNLKEENISSIDNKLLNKYLQKDFQKTSQENRNNIKNYNHALKEFYDNFKIKDYKHIYTNYSSNSSIYTHGYELTLKHKKSNNIIPCYIEISVNSDNIYSYELKYKDNDINSMEFIENNKAEWHIVNNALNYQQQSI